MTQANASLTEEKSVLATHRDALTKEIAVATQVRDEQIKLAAERQKQIETLTLDHNNHAQQKQEWQEQVLLLTQELQEQKQTIAQNHSELEQRHMQLQQKEDLIANLTSEYAESDIRQRMLNDEILKAEAQIELIKDVLLREPGL